MSIRELIDNLIAYFDADEEGQKIIAEAIWEAFDEGYGEGQEDAERMFLD